MILFQVLLASSALAHTFCKFEHNCHETEPIRKLVAYLKEIVNTCDEGLSSEDSDQVIGFCRVSVTCSEGPLDLVQTDERLDGFCTETLHSWGLWVWQSR